MAGGRIGLSESGAMRGYIDWWSSSNGSQANTSNFTAVLYVYKAGSTSGTTGTWGYGLIVDGQRVEGGNYAYVYDGAVEMTRIDKVIAHNNDGTKAIGVSGWVIGPDGTSQEGNTIEGWGTAYLDTIPRYLDSINIYANGRTINTIGVRWTCNPNRDWTQYSLNGGSWTNANDTVASDNKSGNFTISNLSPNTTYSVKIRLRRSDSGLWSESSTINITTYDIAKISSISNTNHGDNLAITYTNPSGTTIDTSIQNNNGDTNYIAYRRCSGTSYTYIFTDEELDTLYRLYGASNSLNLKMVIRTTAPNGTNYWHKVSFTMTLTGNQKTVKTKIDNNWKRGKIFVKIDNNWKRAVIWTKDENQNWRKGI